MEANPLKLKFLPKIGLVGLFYSILIFTMYLLLGKTNKKFQLSFPPFSKQDFYSHVSNCIISYNIVVIISLIWLLQGISVKFVLWLCIIVVLINVIVETFVTVLNTPDVIDAVYGFAGVLLAGIFAVVAKKYGLKEYRQVGK